MARKRAKPIPQPVSIYDQAGRYFLGLESALLLWLLRVKADEVSFVRWLNTRRLAWPGHFERTCDNVAWLVDHRDNDRPWAVVAEGQRQPDSAMFGRLLEYLGFIWRQARPSDLPDDRFFVGAVVMNLTGKGEASRDMRLGKTGMLTQLGVVECNLEEYSAEDMVREVALELAPRLALVLVPLMQKGRRCRYDSEMVAAGATGDRQG